MSLYHYIECGLKNIWLKNGYTIHETSYGEAVSFHDIEGLHKIIGLSIARNKPDLTPDEFRFLRKEMNLSQSALADLLGVGESTIRSWERGRANKSSEPASRMLRALYLDKINGNEALNDLLERISQLDRDIHERKLTLEETNSGWQEAEAA